MRRFIEHEELARDSRFIRQDAAMSTVLAQMPDDVDTVVNMFEQFTPMIEGSVRGTSAEPLFDAVFLDPFSPSREPDLWQEPFLAAIADRMAPGARLSTYCARYSVRLGLARAGLHVGLGPRVGKKAEGTLASPQANLPPLASRVERRLQGDLSGLTEPILGQPLREGPPRID